MPASARSKTKLWGGVKRRRECRDGAAHTRDAVELMCCPVRDYHVHVNDADYRPLSGGLLQLAT